MTAEGFEPVLVSGSEILAGEFSLQPIRMNPLNVTEEEEKVVVIPAHTLFGEYPPKDSGRRNQTYERDRGDRTEPCGDSGICDRT